MMSNRTNQRGFTFFELMIAVAVVGILSAVAIPAYQGYIDTANMTRVSANFEESVRVVGTSLARRKARLALGIIEALPDTTEGWIAYLNPSGMQAPGGGPAYVPSEEGDAITGAIGVEWTSAAAAKGKGKGGSAKEAQLQIWRPLYSTLDGQTVIITEDDLQISKFK